MNSKFFQILLFYISIAIFIVAILELVQIGAIFVETYVSFQFYASLMAILLLPPIYYFMKKYMEPFAGYIPFFFIFILALALVFTYHFIMGSGQNYFDISAVFPFFYIIISLVIMLRLVIILNSKHIVPGFAFVAYLFIMLLVSEVFILSPYGNNPQILIGSIYDDEATAGVPLLFANALTFFSMQYTLTFSLQLTIIFGMIGMLLIENFRLIIDRARASISQSRRISKFSGVSYAFAGLTCQCEATTSLLPAISSEILGIVSLPLVSESLLLTLFTYIVLKLSLKKTPLKFFERIKKFNKNSFKIIALGLLVIVGEPIALISGIYFGLRQNLLFYASVNVIMFIAGILIVFLVTSVFKLTTVSKPIVAFTTALLSVVFMVIWYVPQFITFSLGSGLTYSVMAITSTFAGLLGGYSLWMTQKSSRIVAMEYIGGMMPVISIIILYITIVQSYNIWPEFGLTQQLYFSIIFLALSLPFMWFFTNYAIYDFSLNSSPFFEHELIQ